VPGFLLDTNVISELVRPAPDEQVLRWGASRSALDLYLSAITIGEPTRGVTRLPAGQRRDRLARWIDEDLQQQFSERILAFDQRAAVTWGKIMGEADRQGRPRAALDAQIAATAIRHGLSLVTRNTADFDGIGVQVMNPWDVP
jgi:predicted nucleic acid-binding protein